MLSQSLLVEHILEGLCGEATELTLGRHLAFVPKSKVSIGCIGRVSIAALYANLILRSWREKTASVQCIGEVHDCGLT